MFNKKTIVVSKSYDSIGTPTKISIENLESKIDDGNANIIDLIPGGWVWWTFGELPSPLLFKGNRGFKPPNHHSQSLIRYLTCTCARRKNDC